MTSNESTPRAGDTLFEEFLEQVKQVLEHLFDFAYLQQHPLARRYDSESDLSAKTAGRQLRYEIIKAIESLKPQPDAHFRAPVARLYNILHLYYVETLNIQSAAAELGLSERQAYRDLRRGQENVAAVLWNNRLPAAVIQTADDFSLDAEVARLKLNFSPVETGDIYRQAERAVERLAQQRAVEIVVEGDEQPIMLSTDAVLAHQIIVSLLSQAIQQTHSSTLYVSLVADSASATLTLRYQPENDVAVTDAFSDVRKLAQRLRWELTCDDSVPPDWQVVLRMTSKGVTILVIDDNEGWIELLSRFLDGYNCLVITASETQDIVQQVQELNPTIIILDVMMPERGGWELLQRLHMHPTTDHIPILVCTVFDDAQLAYSLGASGFVSKPASREKILEALRQATVL